MNIVYVYMRGESDNSVISVLDKHDVIYTTSSKLIQF